MNLKYGEKVKARDGGYIDKEIFDPVIDAAEEIIEKFEENSRATVPNNMKLKIGVNTTYSFLWLNCIHYTYYTTFKPSSRLIHYHENNKCDFVKYSCMHKA